MMGQANDYYFYGLILSICILVNNNQRLFSLGCVITSDKCGN